MTKLRAEGKKLVVLENGWAGGWSFVCVVNPDVCVPEGEAGLGFMRNFIKRNRRNVPPRLAGGKRSQTLGDQPFVKGFVGFLSYEFEPHFVYVDKVFGFKNPKVHPAKRGASKIQRSNKIPNPKSKFHILSALPRSKYFKKIRAIKKYLYDGETYQVNFSQKFSAPYHGDALNLYKKMTEINPSPFQFFMESPAGLSQFAVISNSPERLFRIKGRVIETRPIKGTVPRGKTVAEDKENIKRMLASAKEKAELEMIVDLERNDLGKICKPGTVEVNENRVVEKYSHVFHTVSNVRGVLRDDCDFLDALHALFPGGSVTGCPKKRTMEIIRRLEGEPRGVYCGSAGFIDLSGECDFNIMIRTLWFDKKHGKIAFRSGGGIVVDSDAQKEYEETLHKSAALINAISV